MSISQDTKELNSYINKKVDIESVASFKGNEHIIKLNLKFDINQIKTRLMKLRLSQSLKLLRQGFMLLR